MKRKTKSKAHRKGRNTTTLDKMRGAQLWGGRFSSGLGKDAKAFSYSISVDGVLLEADIRVSIAHATMLTKCTLLSKDEGYRLVRGLQAVLTRLRKRNLSELAERYEDIHTLIQSELEEEIGTLAHKLHMGRSRNDQVVTATRVYLKDRISELLSVIVAFQKVLVGKAEKHAKVLVPGYTHLQRAQVVSLAHHLLAYAEMFERDRQRFQDARDRMDELVLGSAALGGTSLPIDRAYVQKMLHFQRLSPNSMDGVSDRDFIIETLSAAAITFMHLSRLAEDLIIWNSAEFGFITLTDAYSTGSSLMPQKKNPDMLELVRGKSGAAYGYLLSVLVMMKGLPLTYNRDMQEDKKPLFTSLKEVKEALEITTGVLKAARVNAEAAERSVSDGGLYATDVADYLVLKGVPFKDAHARVGQLVRLAERKKKQLGALSLADFKNASRHFERDVLGLFSAAKSVGLKKSVGSTSPKSLKEQFTKWRRKLRAYS